MTSTETINSLFASFLSATTRTARDEVALVICDAIEEGIKAPEDMTFQSVKIEYNSCEGEKSYFAVTTKTSIRIIGSEVSHMGEVRRTFDRTFAIGDEVESASLLVCLLDNDPCKYLPNLKSDT